MEAGALLLRIGQVEAGTGSLVVDVPLVIAETVVLPAHAGEPKGLKVGTQLFESATEQLQSVGTFVATSHESSQAGAQTSDDPILGICTSLSSPQLISSWPIRLLSNLGLCQYPLSMLVVVGKVWTSGSLTNLVSVLDVSRSRFYFST